MKFGALIFAVSSPAVWAGFGNIVPNSSIPHRPCVQTTFERSADLLHKVALMPVTDEKGEIIKDKDGRYKDTRQNLLEGGSKLSGALALNSAEIHDMNNATATISCSGEGVLNASNSSVKNASDKKVKLVRDGSGFLYGNGEQFATAYHNLLDAQGNLLKSCVLKPGSNSEIADPTPLDLSMIDIIKDPGGQDGSEIAVIKLKSKLFKRNGEPIEGLQLSSTGRPVDFKDKVGMVSTVQFKGDRSKAGVRAETIGGPGKPVIVQECKRPYDPRIVDTPVFYGECSSTPGASGGYGYSRVNGKVEVSVMFMGSAKPALDGTPFNLDTGQFAYGVILDQAKVKRMMDFQNSRKLQGMEASPGSKKF